MGKRIRVVVGKLGLDGHDLGAKMIASSLKNAGMEVIYTGRNQTPEQVISTVIQESADVLGISILSGAHMGLMKRLMDRMNEKKVNDCMVILGGLIPKSDRPKLLEMGVAAIFSGGTDVKDAVQFITERA